MQPNFYSFNHKIVLFHVKKNDIKKYKQFVGVEICLKMLLKIGNVQLSKEKSFVFWLFCVFFFFSFFFGGGGGNCSLWQISKVKLLLLTQMEPHKEMT